MSLLDPVLPGGFSDAAETITRREMAERVAAVKSRLAAEGLARAPLCLPVDAGLGTLAVLIAVLDMGGRVALIARGGPSDAPDCPAFCTHVVLPPLPGAPLETLQILSQARAFVDEPGAPGQIWVRSSGTTGTPKWMLHDLGAMVDNARAVISRMQIGPQDRVMIPVPVHHMFGLGAAFLPALIAGASIHMVARGNPLAIFQAQRSFRPDVMYLVPSQCRSMMALGRKAGRMRVIVVAGDRLAPDEARAFEEGHGPVINLYGSSEMGVISGGVLSDPADLRHVTAGPPMDGVRLAIEPPANPEPGAEGALSMRLISPYRFRGYADPQTGKLLDPAPETWPTGDLVRLHPATEGAENSDPRIEILGRSDHAVNRDGLLVHLGQIEGCLAGAKGVALATVVAAGQSRRGVGLVAFCTLQRAGMAAADDIVAHCRAHLAPRAVPDTLHLIDEMPMLPSGKVDRRRLTEMAKAMAALVSASG